MPDQYKSLRIGPDENPEYAKILGWYKSLNWNPVVANIFDNKGKYKRSVYHLFSGQLGGQGFGTAWHRKVGAI